MKTENISSKLRWGHSFPHPHLKNWGGGGFENTMRGFLSSPTKGVVLYHGAGGERGAGEDSKSRTEAEKGI